MTTESPSSRVVKPVEKSCEHLHQGKQKELRIALTVDATIGSMIKDRRNTSPDIASSATSDSSLLIPTSTEDGVESDSAADPEMCSECDTPVSGRQYGSPSKFRRLDDRERLGTKFVEESPRRRSADSVDTADDSDHRRKNTKSVSSRTYRMSCGENVQHNGCSAIAALRRWSGDSVSEDNVSSLDCHTVGLETRQRGSCAALEIMSTMSDAEIEGFLNSDCLSDLTLDSN